jgi:c-di-GMP-related signal transduction protein
LGFPLFNFLHPDDHQLLRNQLELLPSDQLVEDISETEEVSEKCRRLSAV